MIEKLHKARLGCIEKKLRKELSDTLGFSDGELGEYLPSLAIELLISTWDFVPHRLDTKDKMRDVFQAILKYLKNMHDSERYASPNELRRTIGPSGANRIFIQVDDILRKEALDLRAVLSNHNADALGKLKQNLSADKKELERKIERFLDSDDLGLAVLFDGKIFTADQLKRYINMQTDSQLKQSASNELQNLLQFKKVLLGKAQELYENFILHGETPEEKDFRLPKSSSISYKLSFIEDRLVSRVMAFANTKMLGFVDSVRKSEKVSPSRPEAPTRVNKLRQAIKLLVLHKSARAAALVSPRMLGQKKNEKNALNERIESVKDTLLKALQDGNADKCFKGNWHKSEKGKIFYGMAIKAFADALQKGVYDKEKIFQHFQSMMRQQNMHKPYKERAAQTVFNRVLAAFESFGISFAKKQKGKEIKKPLLSQDSVDDKKSFWFWGVGGFVAGLAALAAAWAFYPGKENITFKENKFISVKNNPASVEKSAQQKVERQTEIQKLVKPIMRLKTVEKELMDLRGDFANLERKINDLQKTLSAIKREIDSIKSQNNDLTDLSRKALNHTLKLEEEIKVLLKSLAKNKLTTFKQQLEKQEKESVERSTIVVAKGESLELIFQKKGLIRAMRNRGFSSTQARQALALFRLSLLDLFKSGTLDYKKFNFKKASPDFILTGQSLALYSLLNARFSVGLKGYGLLDYIFSKERAKQYKMYSLDEKALLNLKEIFQDLK